MSFISFNYQTNKLYISRTVVVGFIISALTLFGLLVFWLIFYIASPQLQYFYNPKKLGVAPPALQKVTDPNQVVSTFTQAVAEKYGETFNIIFFLDGYTKSADGVPHATRLESALGKDPYFKKLLPLITTTIFTSEGQKCFVKDSQLQCDKHTLKGLSGLGIAHEKIVVLSPLDFNPEADQALGKNSLMSISTNRPSAAPKAFLDGLKKSISLDVLPLAAQEQYLNGVIYCFYGGKESYIWNGKFNNCTDFTKQYPDFWVK